MKHGRWRGHMTKRDDTQCGAVANQAGRCHRDLRRRFWIKVGVLHKARYGGFFRSHSLVTILLLEFPSTCVEYTAALLSFWIYRDSSPDRKGHFSVDLRHRLLALFRDFGDHSGR